MNDLAALNAPTPYMLPVGKRDEERLDALGAIYNEKSMEWLKRCDLPSDASILNVGSGNGGFTIKVATQNPKYTCFGIDISPEQINIASKRANEQKVTNVKWKVCDVYHLDQLQEEYPKLFDVVRSRFVLTHLVEPKKALDSMLNMLKPGGFLILEEVSEKLTHEVLPEQLKALRAWKTMVELQAEMQHSHRNTAEICLEYLADKTSSVIHEVFDILVEGAQKKSMYRMGTEIAIKKLQEMNSPESIQLLGYDDPQVWLQEILDFEKDDTQSLAIRNFTFIKAVK